MYAHLYVVHRQLLKRCHAIKLASNTYSTYESLCKLLAFQGKIGIFMYCTDHQGSFFSYCYVVVQQLILNYVYCATSRRLRLKPWRLTFGRPLSAVVAELWYQFIKYS